MPLSVPCVACSPMQLQTLSLAPSHRAQHRESGQLRPPLWPPELLPGLRNTRPRQEPAGPSRDHTESPGELLTLSPRTVAPGGGNVQAWDSILLEVHKRVAWQPESAHRAFCRTGAGYPTGLGFPHTDYRENSLPGLKSNLGHKPLSPPLTWYSNFQLPRTSQSNVCWTRLAGGFPLGH